MMEHAQDVKCIAWHPHEEASRNPSVSLSSSSDPKGRLGESRSKLMLRVTDHRSSLPHHTTHIFTSSSTTPMAIGVPFRNSIQNSQPRHSPSPPRPHPLSRILSSHNRPRSNYRSRLYWRMRLFGLWRGVLVEDTWLVGAILVVSGYGHGSESSSSLSTELVLLLNSVDVEGTNQIRNSSNLFIPLPIRGHVSVSPGLQVGYQLIVVAWAS